MAYMNQEKKAVIAAKLKKILAGTGVKYSLSVHNHLAISMTIKSAPVDFIQNFNETIEDIPGWMGGKEKGYVQVNTYHYRNHFSGKAKELLEKIVPALYGADYYDNSDAMTDYFDTAYYVHLNIGRWDKDFVVQQ